MIQFSKLFDLVNKRGLTASFTKSRFGCSSLPTITATGPLFACVIGQQHLLYGAIYTSR